MGAAFLRCEDYETAQMLDFAVRGFRYLKNCARIFFCPADVPLFTEHTLRVMLSDIESGGRQIVIPVCGGRKGHPVLIDAALVGQIEAYRGDRGQRKRRSVTQRSRMKAYFSGRAGKIILRNWRSRRSRRISTRR